VFNVDVADGLLDIAVLDGAGNRRRTPPSKASPSSPAPPIEERP
jgi:hypothetical protein